MSQLAISKLPTYKHVCVQISPISTFMSTSQASNPTEEMAPAYIHPLLSDEAHVAFVNLLHKYCIELPKSQDEQDFHLATVRLSAAIDVCL